MPSKNGNKPQPEEESLVAATEPNGKLGMDEPTSAEATEPARVARDVPYSPVPMSWNISQGRKGQNDDLVVIIKIVTPEGDKVFFLEPAFGKDLGSALIKMSEASEKGIVYTD